MSCSRNGSNSDRSAMRARLRLAIARGLRSVARIGRSSVIGLVGVLGLSGLSGTADGLPSLAPSSFSLPSFNLPSLALPLSSPQIAAAEEPDGVPGNRGGEAARNGANGRRVVEKRPIDDRTLQRSEDVKQWLERVAGVRTVSPWQRDHASVRAAFLDVVAEARRYTVRVLSNETQVALGTIVDSQGFVLTKASELNGKISCVLLDGRQVAARLTGVNEEHDLAMLRIEAQDLPAVDWIDGDAPGVGSFLATPSHDKLPAAIGVLSAVARKIEAPTGFLGIGLDQVQARITQVFPGGGADKAGLQVNDLVLKVNGIDVNDRDSLQRAIRRHQPGQKLELAIRRGAQSRTILATLGESPLAATAERLDVQNKLGGQLSQRRAGFPTVLQHDTVLRPNECGGPLVDLDGQVVGINIARAGRVASYAIPADAVQSLLADLKSGKLEPRHVAADDMTVTMPTSLSMP